MPVIERLRRYLGDGGLAKAVSMLVGSTVLGQLASLAAAPILTRLYTPDDFGVLTVFVAVVALGTVIASLQLHNAVLIPERDDDASVMLRVSLGLAGTIALLLAIPLLLVGDRLPEGLRLPHQLVWWASAGVLLAAVLEASTMWGTRKSAYGAVAWGRSTEGVAKPLAQIGAGFVGLGGPVGLIGGTIVGRFGGVVAIWTALWRGGNGPSPRVEDTAPTKTLVHRFRSFILFSAPGALLNTGGLQAAPVMLAALYDPAIAGLFALCQRMVALPSVFLGRAVGEVYTGELARRLRESPETLAPLFRRTWLQLLAFSAVPAVVLLAFGPPLFDFVFGSEWREAGVYAQALAPMLVLQVAVVPVSRTLHVLERQRWLFSWSAFRLAAVAAAIFVPQYLGATPTQTLLVYAAAMSLAYVVLWTLCRAAIRAVRPPAKPG